MFTRNSLGFLSSKKLRALLLGLFVLGTGHSLVSCTAEPTASSGSAETEEVQTDSLNDSFSNPTDNTTILDDLSTGTIITDTPITAATTLAEYNLELARRSVKLDVLDQCSAQNLGHKPGEESCLTDFETAPVACDTVSISTYLATNYSYDSYIDLVEPFVGNDLSEAERYTNYGCYENADQSAFVIYLVRLNPATTVGGQFSYDSQEVRLER